MFSLFTSIFWIDVELFIKKMLDISLQLSGFDVIIYFSDHGFDKDKAYFIQLLILMGKIMSPVPSAICASGKQFSDQRESITEDWLLTGGNVTMDFAQKRQFKVKMPLQKICFLKHSFSLHINWLTGMWSYSYFRTIFLPFIQKQAASKLLYCSKSMHELSNTKLLSKTEEFSSVMCPISARAVSVFTPSC